jgi:hypothetical protein
VILLSRTEGEILLRLNRVLSPFFTYTQNNEEQYQSMSFDSIQIRTVALSSILTLLVIEN